MAENQIKIEDVSDTALWVAHYRSLESERSDALFRDPLAKVLVGERGQKIAENMQDIGRYTQWAVVSRTVIIDKFIQSLIAEGVDTILNLGAGLDTRPYRMNLPSTLNWIEVDYPKIITLKNERLKNENPRCRLRRVTLDLANEKERTAFLSEVNQSSKKILVLTEGVIPYLTQDQVRSLAEALRAQSNIHYWITEYFSPEVYKYLKRSLRTQKMKNAPFQFYPDDWTGFFEKSGWSPREIRYSGEIAKAAAREVPMPWYAALFMLFASKAIKERLGKMTGYMIFEKR
ncbi:MAG TPA: SAM-dependent methyltransferase [Bdellovibrio sp.]|nr:SAM-dependent methyltransferase [Bdellovibrio sp.]